MKKSLIVHFAGFVLLMAAAWLFDVWNSQEVEYVPVIVVWERGDPVFVPDPSKLTPLHRENICKVLEFYHEWYRVDGDKVFIRRRLSRDADLLRNYTGKAGFDEPFDASKFFIRISPSEESESGTASGALSKDSISDEKCHAPDEETDVGLEEGFSLLDDFRSNFKKKGPSKFLEPGFEYYGYVTGELWLDAGFQEEIAEAMRIICPKEYEAALKSAGNMHNPKVAPLYRYFEKAIKKTPTYSKIVEEVKRRHLDPSTLGIGQEKLELKRTDDGRRVFTCIFSISCKRKIQQPSE